jgi:quinol monooxygenase YgiN
MGVTRVNQFEAKSGKEVELRRFLESVISLVRTSAGCRSVQLLESIERPERFAIVEIWDSVEAHQAAARVIPPSKLQEAAALFATLATGAYFRSVRDAQRDLAVRSLGQRKGDTRAAELPR